MSFMDDERIGYCIGVGFCVPGPYAPLDGVGQTAPSPEDLDNENEAG